MVRLLCHSVLQKAELFKIVPTKVNIQDEFILYLKSCIKCEKPVLEIHRFDIWGNKLDPVRLNTRNISKFLDGMNVIWKPEKVIIFDKAIYKFHLNYNEYGTIKKCYQNLSNISLGRIETDPYYNLKLFKDHKAGMS